MTTSATPFTVRFDQLQAEEVHLAMEIADFAATFVCEAALAEMLPKEHHGWMYRTTAYLRSRFLAWRSAAQERAVRSVHATIASGDVGALFSAMPPEKQRVIAQRITEAALRSYCGCLEGTSVITPGEYLRIVEAAQQEERP